MSSEVQTFHMGPLIITFLFKLSFAENQHHMLMETSFVRFPEQKNFAKMTADWENFGSMASCHMASYDRLKSKKFGPTIA